MRSWTVSCLSIDIINGTAVVMQKDWFTQITNALLMTSVKQNMFRLVVQHLLPDSEDTMSFKDSLFLKFNKLNWWEYNVSTS